MLEKVVDVKSKRSIITTVLEGSRMFVVRELDFIST